VPIPGFTGGLKPHKHTEIIRIWYHLILPGVPHASAYAIKHKFNPTHGDPLTPRGPQLFDKLRVRA
jgi:hypothetical protein